MVNFNDETTMTRPRKDIVNIMILQELQDILEAISFMELKDEKDRSQGLPELKSKLLSLITLIRTPLELKLKKDNRGTVKDMRSDIYNLDYDTKEQLYKIVDYLEEFLYSKDVTKWDTKEANDRKDVWTTKQKYLGT